MQQLLNRGIQWDEMLYINFDDECLSGMEAEHLNLLLEVQVEMYGKKSILIPDKTQRISVWEKFVRRIADTKPRGYDTGSNPKMLS
jgi:predicted AAA+ superfamily ATPase